MSRAAVWFSHLGFVVASLALAAGTTTPRRAHAGGLEYTAAGATALGRGGAVAARADDPMVLSYNPAGLAELRGSQLLLDMNLALMSACVDPIGYYGWGVYTGGNPVSLPDPVTKKRVEIPLGMPPASASAVRYYNDPLDTVCLDQNVVPIPQLIVTSRLSEKLGIGGGLVFPSVSPTGRWGDTNGMIRGDTGEVRPAPTRYMLLRTGNIGVFPTVGAAYRAMDWLRVGAAVEWGVIIVDTTTMAAMGTGTSPATDVMAHVRARDLFIPALTASVHVVPTDSVDVVAAFRYQDRVEADGTLDVTTGLFSPLALAHTTKDIEITSLTQNMPWKLRAGVRYADRLVPRPKGATDAVAGRLRPGDLHDPLQDERWDVELDVEYQMNSRVREQVVLYAPNQAIEFEGVPTAMGPGQVTMAAFPDTTAPDSRIQKRWKNQLSLRAGGSYNIVPGVFGVMAGAHYENRGIDPAFMQIDFWPVQRTGLHGGVTLRMFGNVDLVVSYAHIFQETIVVAPPPHLDRLMISANTPFRAIPQNIDKSVGIPGRATLPPLEEQKVSSPDATAQLAQVSTKIENGKPLYIINSGKYRSSMNVLGVGIHSHF